MKLMFTTAYQIGEWELLATGPSWEHVAIQTLIKELKSFAAEEAKQEASKVVKPKTKIDPKQPELPFEKK